MISGDLTKRLRAVDKKLVTAKWPALSPFWTETLERFVASTCRQLVIRAGRRGGKSSSLCRFAIAVALLFANANLIPPGDIGWVVFVSVSREEAAARLFTIAKALEALSIGHHIDGDTITLNGFNIGFRVLTATVSGVSGWTSILIIADEVAKWHDKQTAANPAEEILASLKPTGATTSARVILASSPLTDEDMHAREFAIGDDEHQMVAFAPTWVANPSLTEAETHALERDERIWRREYAAIPQPAVLDGYLADCIDQCVDDRAPGRSLADNGARRTIAIDAAWRGDEFAWCVAHADGQKVVVDDVGGWIAPRGQVLNVEKVCNALAQKARDWGVKEVVADQKDFDALAELLRVRGIRLVGKPWTSANKVGTFRRFRALAMDAQVRLPSEATMIKQLESIGIRMTPSGTETFEGRGADDRAFAVVLAVTTVVAGAGVSDVKAPPLIPAVWGVGSIAADAPSTTGGGIIGGTYLPHNAYKPGPTPEQDLMNAVDEMIGRRR